MEGQHVFLLKNFTISSMTIVILRTDLVRHLVLSVLLYSMFL